MVLFLHTARCRRHFCTLRTDIIHSAPGRSRSHKRLPDAES